MALPSFYQRAPFLLVPIVSAISTVHAPQSQAALPTDNVKAQGAIEEVIVMGQKQGKSLQETPSSIVLLTDEALQTQQITDFQSILERTANVHSRQGGQFSIRGIDGFNVSGSGGNNFLASVYVDGAPLPYRSIRQGRGFSTWDVQQVEVLRGPQSTLQGRNALAGAIVVSTNAPSHEFDARTRVEVGQNGERNLAAAVGGSLTEDELAYRLTGEQRQFDGFNTNTVRNEPSDFYESDNYRAQLLWTPSAIEGLNIKLIHAQNTSEQGISWVHLPENKSIEGWVARSRDSRLHDHRTTAFDRPTGDFTDNQWTTLTATYALNDAIDITTLTTYSQDQYGYQFDSDLTPQASPDTTSDREDKTVTQEVRVNWSFDHLNGVAGIYYSNLDIQEDFNGYRSFSFEEARVRDRFIGSGLPAAQVDALLPFYAAVDPLSIQAMNNDERSVSSHAIFADVTVTLNDHWELLGGFRWDQESQDNTRTQSTRLGSADQLPNPAGTPFEAQLTAANQAFMDLAASFSTEEPYTDTTFDAFLPKLGLSYHWNHDITTSFTAQKAYRSGGVGTNLGSNNTGNNTSTYTFDSEFAWNYELSLRSTWLEDSLTVNANLYRLDWEDQQVFVNLSPTSLDREVQNVGESRVQGAELEAYYQLADAWQVSAGLGYTDTEFLDFRFDVRSGGQLQSIDLSGYEFANAPKETANIGVTYGTGAGLLANVNLNYAADSRAAVNPFALASANSPDFDPRNDARTVINARIGYEWESWGAFLVASNLTDEQYVSNRIPLGQSLSSQGRAVTLGAPRQLTLSVMAKI